MEKIIALAAATILSTSTAALATGAVDQTVVKSPIAADSGARQAPDKDMDKLTSATGKAAATAESPAQKALSPENALAAAAAAQADPAKMPPTVGKALAAAIAENDKAMDDAGIAYADARATYLAARTEEPGEAMAATEAADPAKELSVAAASPFGAVTESEIAAVAKSGEETAMGGPLDPADMIEEGWDSHDTDADGALTPLEFGRWIADDAGKDELSVAAEEERDSAAEGTATVALLNGTSLEFSQADADNDARVSAEELSAYMDA